VADILEVKLSYRLAEYAWPGHDFSYSLSVKGTPQHVHWQLTESFEELLLKTVLWYRDHLEWLI
jgi:dTDP-D-glucose 4,6-dehydratase